MVDENIRFIGKCLLIEIDKEKILCVGDLHLGYEEVLNEAGVFVSRKMFGEMIEYFDRIFKKVGKVNRVILLGDVKHDFGKIVKQEWNDVLGLFDYLNEKFRGKGNIIVVKGNHDKIIEPITRKRENIVIKDYFIIDKYCFMHGDRDFLENYDKKVKCWIVGHGHPAVKISDDVKVEKYKCFLEGEHKEKRVIVVPSFFSGNEGSDPRENDLGMAWKFKYDKFKVRVVSGDKLEVLDFGQLGKMK